MFLARQIFGRRSSSVIPTIVGQYHPHRPSHRAMSVNAAQPFLDVLTERRSIYQISKEAVIPDDRVVEIVQHAVKHAPSSL